MAAAAPERPTLPEASAGAAARSFASSQQVSAAGLPPWAGLQWRQLLDGGSMLPRRGCYSAAKLMQHAAAIRLAAL